MHATSYRERRRSLRLVPPVEIEGTVGATVPARVVDLSSFGAQVEVDMRLRPGATCAMVLPAGDGPLTLEVEVRRCRAVGVQDARIVYRAGLEFRFAERDPAVDLVEDMVVDLSLTEVKVRAE
jgi:hypothetical protein